jgi:hypothetical protein
VAISDIRSLRMLSNLSGKGCSLGFKYGYRARYPNWTRYPFVIPQSHAGKWFINSMAFVLEA